MPSQTKLTTGANNAYRSSKHSPMNISSMLVFFMYVVSQNNLHGPVHTMFFKKNRFFTPKEHFLKISERVEKTRRIHDGTALFQTLIHTGDQSKMSWNKDHFARPTLQMQDTQYRQNDRKLAFKCQIIYIFTSHA